MAQPSRLSAPAHTDKRDVNSVSSEFPPALGKSSFQQNSHSTDRWQGSWESIRNQESSQTRDTVVDQRLHRRLMVIWVNEVAPAGCADLSSLANPVVADVCDDGMGRRRNEQITDDCWADAVSRCGVVRERLRADFSTSDSRHNSKTREK